ARPWRKTARVPPPQGGATFSRDAGCWPRGHAVWRGPGRGSTGLASTRDISAFSAAPGWCKLARKAWRQHMLDLIIRGGDVVTPEGVVRCDVAIKGERIVALSAGDTLEAGDAQRVIDAAGKIVMPGGIDPHVHMQHPFMVPDG